MGIINYKKPAGVQGLQGADGVSWSSSVLSVGSQQCPYGGILLTSSGGQTRAICNLKPRPEIYAQVISDKLLSTFATFTFLNKIRIPVVDNTSYTGLILLNKQIGVSPIGSDVNFEVKIDNVILASQPVITMSIGITELSVPFTVTSNTTDYMEFEIRAKNTASGRNNQIGPIFIRMD